MMSTAIPKPQILQARRPALWQKPGAAPACRGPLALLLCLLVACSDQHSSDSILVAAAASLRDVATELGDEYERRSGTRVDFNFAGSNILAQQIAAATQVDVFLSADQRWIDFLAERGRLSAGSCQTFLTNKLVVIARDDSGLRMDKAADLATHDYKHLVMADPEAVPAGRYTKSWLESRPHADGSLWQAIAPRVVPALDVRAALALVESDPRLVGVVYASDQLASKRTRVLFEPAKDQQPSINYCAALIAMNARSAAAARFFEYLVSEEPQPTFRRHGFGAPR